MRRVQKCGTCYWQKEADYGWVTNDVCIVYPAISAIEDGFEVQVVVDAGGSPTTLADETALRRMEKHGVDSNFH